jgi:hypothetical protein
MGQVGGDAGSVDDIVESELVNERAGFQEERKRLSSALAD